jgi:hypothetical protein
MPITEKTLIHWINNFFGYGSWNARIWFVSYEETGGDTPGAVADKLDYFYAEHPSGDNTALCDIRKLYRNVAFRIDGPKAKLFTNLFEYRFDSNAILHGVWKNLIAFVHGYNDQEIPDLIGYQKNSFAIPSSNSEALIPLFPLPSPHNHAWYYSWLSVPGVDFLKSRTLYQEHLYQSRINRILQNIQMYKPEVVLMYGMENINALKKSVQEIFPSASFKSVKAIKLQIPQHHATRVDETHLLITTQIPALRHNRIETGFDWQEFGKAIRQSQ